jgi:predicted nucleic-acid-binding protein
VAHTVLLETEWVLRRSYRFARAEISGAFLGLLGLTNVSCPRPDSVLAALRAFDAGCDFADALHAATAEQGVTELVTFDRHFVRNAAQQPLLPRVRLLAS